MRTQVMVLFAKRCCGFFFFKLAEDVVSWIFPRDSVQVPSGLTGTKFHPAKWTEERETLAVCPLHPHLCSEQVMPSPERVQKTRVDNQGTEQGRQKESSNHHHHAHNQDLPDSSETQLPRDAQHVMASGPQPELSLEAVGENPTWIAVEDHKALGRRNNPRVNWNPDHWLRRYNYMDIYICIYIYIYMLCTRDWAIRYHWTNCSSPLGAVLGTPADEREAPVESEHRSRREKCGHASVTSIRQVMSWKQKTAVPRNKSGRGNEIPK